MSILRKNKIKRILESRKSPVFETETAANGKRVQNAVKRWKSLLEDTSYGKICTKPVKETTAMMLDNEFRYLSEAATNTSIFGPMNGLQGGALHATDGYAPGDNRLPKILVPMVRRIYPALMSNETVGVQPMPGPVALGFALRYKYLKGPLHAGDSDTRHVHNEDATPDGPMYSKYNASGIKGIETKFVFTAHTAANGGSHDLIVIDGQGYPKPLKVAFVYPVAGGKFVAAINPIVESLVGTVELPAPDDDASELLKAAEKNVDKKFVELVKTKKTAVAYKDGTQYDSTTIDTIVSNGALNPDTADITVTGAMVGVSSWTDPAQRVDGKGNPLFSTVENSEMGYQKLDTRFTGRQDARLAEPLAGGKWQFRPEDTGIAALMQQYEGTGAIAKTSFGFEKCSVEAGTRRLSTSWTLETEEDLKNTNGIDIETEATQQMSYEMQAEIDREMTVRMLYSCLSKDEWSLWDGQLADSRWLGERGRAFYQHLIKMSIRMQTRNRRGPANFIVCTPDVAAVLENLDEFVAMPAQSNISTSNIATAKVGTLGGSRFNVYIDTRTPVYDTTDYGAGYEGMFEKSSSSMPNYCMLGYKGAESYDAGIIYCPYIPIMVQQAVNPVNFTPKVGLMTRYGVLDNIFGAELYYHCIIIDSFAQPGVPDTLRKVYPSGYITRSIAETGGDLKFNYPVQVSGTVTTATEEP